MIPINYICPWPMSTIGHTPPPWRPAPASQWHWLPWNSGARYVTSAATAIAPIREMCDYSFQLKQGGISSELIQRCLSSSETVSCMEQQRAPVCCNKTHTLPRPPLTTLGVSWLAAPALAPAGVAACKAQSTIRQATACGSSQCCWHVLLGAGVHSCSKLTSCTKASAQRHSDRRHSRQLQY